MDLRDYVRLLRRRWRLIAVCVLVGLSASIAVTLTATKLYTAKAQLFVSAQDRSTGADISSAYTGGLFTQQRVKSYVSVIPSVRTAGLVQAELNLSASPASIAKKISASAPLDTVLINVSVTDADPAQAQAIANAVGRVFPTLVDQIERPQSGGPSPVKVSMVQSAQLPGTPTSPRPKLNLILGFLVGLAVGVGGAVLRETLDTSVKGPEQAQELVGAPVLGAINYDPEASKKPLVVVASPNSVRAEAFRQLRTNLQFVDIEHPLRSVVFTSSVPGEGKSTTTCNLAITLAQAGLRVVLVEGDLRRPRIADYMGLEGAVGLTSVLLGRTGLDEALQSWGDDSLHVLASGPLPPNPSELLGSQGMQDLLRELEARADIVLIDAPPLLPVTDAAVLGTLTSGLVMLIRSNITRREQATRAVATVHAVGATLLGGVLNMVPTKGPDSYSYGYGYGYSYKPRVGANRLGTDESHVVGAARRPNPSIGSENRPPLESIAPTADSPVLTHPEEVLPHLRHAESAPHTPDPVPTEAQVAPRGAPAPSIASPPPAQVPEPAPQATAAQPVAAHQPAEQVAAEPPAEVDYFTKTSKAPASETWWEHAQSPQPPADNT
jgi:non-specific protein-tyrosine kinase